MDKKNMLVSSIALACLATILFVFLNIESILFDLQLSQEYPGFLQPVEEDLLDSRIASLEGKDLDFAKLALLSKLLWIKKDFFKDSYLTLGQRQGFIEKVSIANVTGLEETNTKLNVLKYKLGVNDLEELSLFYGPGALNIEQNICRKIDSIKEEVNWQDSCDASHLIEAKFFCGMELSQHEIDAAEESVSKQLGNCVEHCSEHCFEDVPVYVNDCSQAKNDNEAYHCLLFLS